jgi:hypothetical protein
VLVAEVNVLVAEVSVLVAALATDPIPEGDVTRAGAGWSSMVAA